MKNMNYKSENGITMVALVTTIVIMLILVSVISFGAKNGLDVKEINDMYTDILILEEKISLYWLENGSLPVKGTSIDDSVIPEEIKNTNPNDSNIYFEIDLSKLDNITLNNGRDSSNFTDKYIVDSISHTVYYLAGVEVDEYKETSVTKTNKTFYYTIPREYEEVDIASVISEVETVTYKKPEIDVVSMSIDLSGVLTVTTLLKNPEEVENPITYWVGVTEEGAAIDASYTEIYEGTDITCQKKFTEAGQYYLRIYATDKSGMQSVYHHILLTVTIVD